MNSTLSFHVVTDQQDWKLRGAYRNAQTGIVKVNTYAMFGCWTPAFLRTLPAPTLTAITLNRIELYGGNRTVVNSSSLNLAMFKLTHISASASRWEGDLIKKFGQPEPGIYDLELTDSAGRQFFSNPFWVETKCTNPPTPVASFLTNSPGSGIFVIQLSTNSQP